MLSCRDTAKITASGQKVSLLKRPGLWFHHLICKACRAYSYQMELLSKGVRKINLKDEAKEKALVEKVLKNLKDLD